MKAGNAGVMQAINEACEREDARVQARRAAQERCNAIMRENRERIERTKMASTWSEAEGKWKAKTTDSNTVFMDVGKPIDIPMGVAKWLAICELFPRVTRLGLGHEAQHACYPMWLQVLKNGKLRVLFQVCWEEDLQRISVGPKPFIEVYTDELEREALTTKPMPHRIVMGRNDWEGQIPMLSAIASAKLLAELLLAVMEDLHTVGAKDDDTLQAVFDQATIQVKHTSRRRLTDAQLASILELADQCRPRLASPPALDVDIFPVLDASPSSRSGSPSSEARRAELAKPPLSKVHLDDRIKLYQVRYLPPDAGGRPWFRGKSPDEIRRQAAALSA